MFTEKDKEKFGIIPVPKMLPRMVFLKNGLARYILTEDIILANAEKIFEMYAIKDKAVSSVTRNADLKPDDETYDFEEDFRHHMKRILRKTRAFVSCQARAIRRQFERARHISGLKAEHPEDAGIPKFCPA